MKKLLGIIPVAVLLAVAGCSQDKNNNCACDGSYGTNFYGASADSSCTVWKIQACPKTYTCTCTNGAPAAIYYNVDSATAATKCQFDQTQEQNLHPGAVCNL
jgi:hypothetical protein